MNLLALETSSRVGTVALATPAGVAVREIATPREQTGQLLEHIDALLREVGLPLTRLDGIVLGRGPGSFTGLRVAAAVAQGLAAAAEVPVALVSSLVGLAEGARREHGAERCVVCVDAHMGEVYWTETSVRDGFVAAGEERIGPPGDVVAPAELGWFAVGDGFAAHAEALAALAARATRTLPERYPVAIDLLPIGGRDLAAGRGVAAAEALPVYLRERTAWRQTS